MILRETFDDNVVYVGGQTFPKLVLKDFVDEPLECGPRILEDKGHHFVVEGAFVGDEGSVFFVLRVHRDLTVHRKSIQEAKHLVTRNVVHELVDGGRSLMSSIFAQTQLAIRLAYEDHV